MNFRMYKGKLWTHQLVLFGVLGALILWSVVNKSFVFNLSLLWWLLGAMVGFMFVFFDRFFYSILSRPNETMNIKLNEIVAKKNYSQEISLLLAERFEQKEMVMRSAMFVVVWAVLAFFTASSATNFFGRGLVLGIGTHLIFDLIYDFRMDKMRLDQWFWQIKRTLEPEEKFWFVTIMGVVYVFLAINL